MPQPVDPISCTPRRAAVLGSPVGHSLSPVLHAAAYAALGLTGWSYDRHECDERGLAPFVAGLGPEWAGLSLTMPLKRAALDVAAAASPLATAVGAANTLLPRPDGAWWADNTDVAGIAAALREAGVTRVRRAVVLGAGGTAQAALAALVELGEAEPTVLVRDAGRAGELRAAAERLGAAPRVVGGYPDLDLDAALDGADVVVSTFPAGAADPVAGARLAPGTAVLDVVYAPWPTALATAAGRAGCRVGSGRDVLLHQAVAQVELMTGRPGPLAAMRAALEAAVTA